MKLTVNNVSYGYEETSLLWKDVSFTVGKGEIFSIMGSNGCGKSTLLRCVIGFYKPFTGSVTLEDGDHRYSALEDTKAFTERIGYVPQIQNTAYSFSIRDYVVMGRAPHLGLFQKPGKEDYEITDEVLQEMGIYDIRDRSFNLLSGGQQRQAVIARAIVQDPELIIMDEPTNHLDYGNQYRVIKMIEKLSERGIGVILTTHMPDHAMTLGHKVGVIVDHHMVVGKASEVITEELLEKIYKVRVHLVDIPSLHRRVCVAE